MKKLIACILLFLLSFGIFADETALTGVLDLSGICFLGIGMYAIFTPEDRTKEEIACGWISIGISIGLLLLSGIIQDIN